MLDKAKINKKKRARRYPQTHKPAVPPCTATIRDKERTQRAEEKEPNRATGTLIMVDY